jgi:hypothetical protein
MDPLIVNGYRIEPGADLQGADLRDADLRWADLRDADLKGVDLKGASLRWCMGDGIVIKHAHFDRYRCAWTKYSLAIGCEQHTIEEWKRFTDDRITIMDSHALTWWTTYKDVLLDLVSKSIRE